MSKCKKCGKEVVLPFTCTYCGKAFCDEHRLPESHECNKLPEDAKFWYRHKKLVNTNTLQLGVCPNCGSQSSEITGYDAKTMTFQCKECGEKYVQSKAFPYGYVGHEPVQSEAYPHEYTEPRDKTESYGKPRTKRHYPIKKVIGGIVAIMIIIAILGGFAYSYINKLDEFNQTKSDLESLGYTISNNVEGMDISAFIKSASPVVPMVDLASFISVARQYNSTTIYESGYSFYVIIVTLMILVSAYEYTPNNSIWWIW
jgi:hypothetical protein